MAVASLPASAEMAIGVHGSVFHLDDALCCCMLKYLPRYKDAKIVRSVDPAVLDRACEIGWLNTSPMFCD